MDKTNLKQIREEMRKRVYYKDIYKNSNNFYIFKRKIFEICYDLIDKAYEEIEYYLKSKAVKDSKLDKHLYVYTEAIASEQLIEPIWYGFIAEEYNVDLFQKMGIEVYTFTEEDKERLFDDEYSIDHIIKLNGRWIGVQSKCRTFLNIDIKDKINYYNKHIKCINAKDNRIKNIYYIFYEPHTPNKKCRFDSYKKIDNIELNGFLIPYDEVVKVIDNSAMCNVSYYDFTAVDYQTLFTTEEEEEEFDDMPF